MTYEFGERFLYGDENGDVVRVISYDSHYNTYNVDVHVKLTDRFKYRGQIIEGVREEDLIAFDAPEEIIEPFNPPKFGESQSAAGGLVDMQGGEGVGVITGAENIQNFIDGIEGGGHPIPTDTGMVFENGVEVKVDNAAPIPQPSVEDDPVGWLYREAQKLAAEEAIADKAARDAEGE